MANLLIVSHSATGGAAAMADAVEAGANHPDIEGVEVRARHATAAGPADIPWANAIIIGTPENFGSVSGLVKDFLERIYYPCLDSARGLPYAVFVRSGNDGTGAHEAIVRICTGLGWREACPAVIAQGERLTDAHLESCYELGATMAARLAAGLG